MASNQDNGAEDTGPITFNDVIGISKNPQITDSPLGLGKRREWSDLQKKEIFFLAVTGASLLATLIMTIYRLALPRVTPEAKTDFAFALVLLISIIFCIWYLVQGVLQERSHELMALVITTIVVWLYIIINYALGIKGTVKMIRLIVSSALSPFLIVLGILIAKKYHDSGRLIFRTVGANSIMQDMCKVLFAFHAMLKFDLQLSACMVVFILHNGVKVTVPEIVILSVGCPLTLILFCGGFIATRTENKLLTIIFVCLSPLQPAYVMYEIIDTGKNFSSDTDSLGVPLLICAVLTLVIRVAMLLYLILTWLNYGKGLKEKVYGIKNEDAPEIPRGEQQVETPAPIQ